MKSNQQVPMPLAAIVETNLEITHEVGSELDTMKPVDTGELKTLDMADRLTDDAMTLIFQ